MKSKLVLTVYANIQDEDKVIEHLSKIVKEHDGEWIKSNFSALASGKFVGMVLVEIEMRFENVFYAHLEALKANQIYVEAIPYVDHIEQNESSAYVDFSALDKPDAMKKLAISLKKNNIKVSGFKAQRVQGDNSSVTKLNASFMVDLPNHMTHCDLQQLLETNKAVLKVAVN